MRMKKIGLLSALIGALCLPSCTLKKQDTIEYAWTDEQLEMFNQYLEGVVLPVPHKEIKSFSYYASSIVFETDFDTNIASEYANALEVEEYTVTYYEDSDSYGAKKYISLHDYVSVSFVAIDEPDDSCFQVSASIRTDYIDRDHVWTDEEVQLFEEHLNGQVLPFPDTTHVSIRYTNNPSNNYIYITGDYNETVLDNYLAELVKQNFTLSKHPSYGIDVAKMQFSNNRYIELWVAIADERQGGGGVFFEVYGYLYSGVIMANSPKYKALGSYPQSEVGRRSQLFSEISKTLGELPEKGNIKDWNVQSDCYGEYELQEIGLYKDVTYKGDKYRAIYYTELRNWHVSQPTGDPEYPHSQTDNGYYANTLYIFKYEPIIWEVLETKDGTQTLAPTNVLDITHYSINDIDKEYYDSEDEATRNRIYNTNYEHSFIRQFINNEFYNTAFNEEEKSIILKTLVDNSINSIDPTEEELHDTDFIIADDYHDYICNDTEDYMFLLSKKDILTYDFGYGDFDNWQNIDNDKASKCATDYALARGAHKQYDAKKTIYERSVKFYLRSPLISSYFGNLVYISNDFGGMHYSYADAGQTLGVFPCMNIALS